MSNQNIEFETELLSKMIIFATHKHANQKCKGGEPYILHPLAVMGKVKSLKSKIVAVAHDLKEDTDTTSEDLVALGCTTEMIDAMDALTKIKGEGRIENAYRVRENKIACEVKLADLEHNMDLSRLVEVSAKDLKRLQEYEQVKAILLQAKEARWNSFLS